MNDNKSGLMSSTGPNQVTAIMDEIRSNLAPRSGPPASLEERLERLTTEQRNTVLQTAKLVQSAMRMHLAAGSHSMGYRDLVRSMYGCLTSALMGPNRVIC